MGSHHSGYKREPDGNIETNQQHQLWNITGKSAQLAATITHMGNPPPAKFAPLNGWLLAGAPNENVCAPSAI